MFTEKLEKKKKHTKKQSVVAIGSSFQVRLSCRGHLTIAQRDGVGGDAVWLPNL